MIPRIALTLAIQLAATAAFADPAVTWKPLQPGVELATIQPGPLYVVRINPARATLAAGLASEEKSAPKTAAEWCRTSRFAVATNLGMFNDDHRTHTGYLRHGRHINSKSWNTYRSVLALQPQAPSLRPALWRDLDSSTPPPVVDQYNLVVQNLRLIAGGRQNVWAASNKRWSEAALAIDSRGRLLFLFSRAPHTMCDFNRLLLALPSTSNKPCTSKAAPKPASPSTSPASISTSAAATKPASSKTKATGSNGPSPTSSECSATVTSPRATLRYNPGLS